MRPVLAALVLSILAFAAPAQAKIPLNQPVTCFSSADGRFALEGYLEVFAGRGDGPPTYGFDREFPPSTYNGNTGGEDPLALTSGALAGGSLGVAPAGTTMPGDQVEGRAWPLLLQRPGTPTWYCHSNLVFPRRLLRGEIPWVEHRTGVPVRLPWRFDQGSLNQTLDGVPYSSVVTRVRVATNGLWRLELSPGPCSGSGCSSLAIFSAKRASISQLGHRTPVRLRDGSQGWVGSYGCAYNGPGPDWGPVFCGRNAVVWHANGINYCIEAAGLNDKDLVRLANQTRPRPHSDDDGVIIGDL
jgi:hypothetical protein